jgi:hypothetical protein
MIPTPKINNPSGSDMDNCETGKEIPEAKTLASSKLGAIENVNAKNEMITKTLLIIFSIGISNLQLKGQRFKIL